MVIRILRHLCSGPWSTRKVLTTQDRLQIESRIEESEKAHTGEIVFVLESSLSLHELFSQKTPRERALEVFSMMRVWDTNHNNGILFYFLLADKSFEIVADRGVLTHVSEETLRSISSKVAEKLKEKKFAEGICLGITLLSDTLHTHFPAKGDNTNELQNTVKVI